MHYVTYSQTHIAGGTILNNRITAFTLKKALLFAEAFSDKFSDICGNQIKLTLSELFSLSCRAKFQLQNTL